MKRDDKGDIWQIRVFGGPASRWVCHYCGQPASDLDHIPPVSNYLDGDICFRVPSCAECNNLLGNTYCNDFFDRVSLAKALLAKRYLKVLSLPTWSNEELESMSGRLKESILHSLQVRKAIQDRLDFDILLLGGIGVAPPAP